MSSRPEQRPRAWTPRPQPDRCPERRDRTLPMEQRDSWTLRPRRSSRWIRRDGPSWPNACTPWRRPRPPARRASPTLVRGRLGRREGDPAAAEALGAAADAQRAQATEVAGRRRSGRRSIGHGCRTLTTRRCHRRPTPARHPFGHRGCVDGAEGGRRPGPGPGSGSGSGRRPGEGRRRGAGGSVGAPSGAGRWREPVGQHRGRPTQRWRIRSRREGVTGRGGSGAPTPSPEGHRAQVRRSSRRTPGERRR